MRRSRMKPIKCDNNHFYDADKYDECPHCEKMGRKSSSEEEIKSSAVPKTDAPLKKYPTTEKSSENDKIGERKRKDERERQHKKKSLFSHSKKGEPEPTGYIWDPETDSKTEILLEEFKAYEKPEKRKKNSGEGAYEDPEEVRFLDEGIVEDIADEKTANDDSQDEDIIERATPEAISEKKMGLVDEMRPRKEVKPKDKERDAPQKSVNMDNLIKQDISLRSQVRAVASHQSSDDVKTEAYYDFTNIEPVTGWLVCVKGEYFGQSFNLKAGQNFIGRALNMDIPLPQDTKISRNKHVLIIYDPQNRVFFIQQGEGRQLTYLNGTLLLGHQDIKAYDEIALGDSGFVFIPCCGEHFDWEEYMNDTV